MFQVCIKQVVNGDFKTKKEAEEWASNHLREDEEQIWVVEKQGF